MPDENKLLQLNDEFLMYTTPNGEVRIEVYLADETIWLTQKKMAELFDVETHTINYHLKEIFKSDELSEDAVIRKIRITAEDGKKYLTNFYSLDAIIAVGYRVNSRRATQFRIWATKILKEYLIKGFALDDERLKQAKTLFGTDYFAELLERIRSIRASERRIYQQITDIFAECSIDYDPQSQITKDFFAMVQNKFHFAITGYTAAEIVYSKADKNQANMGLTTWKNSPKGRILQSDVVIAKNYLKEKEIKGLERTISSFFDYIEGLIERRTSFTMQQFAQSVDKFLSFNEFRILTEKGAISQNQAQKKALGEYKAYNKTLKIKSDFDQTVKRLLKKAENNKKLKVTKR